MNRQQFLFTLSALAASSAWAQAFPSKPIKIVVPFGAGGVADQTARAVAQKLSESLGQSVIVDNKPSAGGIVAGELVTKSEADGHTLLLMSNGTAVSTGLFKSLPFDAQKDFAPISTLGTFDIAVVAAEDGKFKTMQELIAFARANPGKLNVGTINIGSTQNLAARLIESAGNLDWTVVPFRGTPDVISALRGGTVDVAVEILGPLMGQINAKAVRALAVMGERRAAKLPDVPTLAQAGISGATASSWNALAAPAKTPRDVIVRINKAVADALNSPDLKAKLADLNVDAQASTPEALGNLLASETRRWSDVIVRAKIEKQ
ncbi:MAG: tripartite tricarboxylate transporter substrate binding protein [Brachymonas sp.]